MNSHIPHIVEVFKTNVLYAEDANKVLGELLGCFPLYKINFDLEDCDKILRVEGDNVSSVEIEILLKDLGFTCEALD